ncbi:DUF1156 domain-containing protein [Cellulosimicrobium sp. ES-005]|uniref:DUF1156 domain-containing protein n=1 Tax=Cellulosimicrobium sp. ES-005 TaxID=3163031 RepID=A0AAU8G8C5_9MICO
MTTPVPHRKLIEVSLPLEEINAESAAEKAVPRKGHPATMHLWWAPRPLAAARAVLFAQLVDDPSSHPDRFPPGEAEKAERERLHGIIRELVKWDEINNEGLYARARAEILASTGGNPPAILDPFAGGGTIPLEAQRLGLEAHASDLNPVPTLKTKALIEIPPTFAGQPPVFPGAADSRLGDWPRGTGMAEDVRRYGALMRIRAEDRIGHLYPQATLPSGEKATVVAWIWARTVTCPNPACRIQMPLVRSWWLAKKKGKETYVSPEVVENASASESGGVRFHIRHDVAHAPSGVNEGTVGRQGARCFACQTAVDLKYVRAESRAKRMGAQLMATVAEGKRQRVYLEPTVEHVRAAHAASPDLAPLGSLPSAALGFRVQGYGMTEWSDLFSDRQLVALSTFSDLVSEMRAQVREDAMAAGFSSAPSKSDDGVTAEAYADAIATYLAMAVSKQVDWSSSLCSWINGHEKVRNTFPRHAMAMTWDYVEINVFSTSVGNFGAHLEWVSAGIDALPAGPRTGRVTQSDASTRDYRGLLIATDPPYYDNIGYSDLSDFFYVWLRRSLRSIHPDLFGTMLVPKAEELVANPYRHGGKQQAEKFFEDGFERVFGRARDSASPDYPITVFYAFKQAELEKEGVASTGWSTFLEGMIREGWTITATWPVRSERGGRMTSVGTNALASSIVLALRPRPETAAATDRTGFLAALHTELADALPKIREGAIAPADLRQTVLGPGMAVYSRYSRVLEADGSRMSVKTALALINATFDEIETEQDADVDADTRFCLDWFKSYGWATRPYGDAESLAVPLGVSVDGVARGGIITSGGGKVALIKPLDLDPRWDPTRDDRTSVWEATCHLARAYATEGREAAARLMAGLTGEGPGTSSGSKVSLDDVQRLALRLYELMETKDAATAGLFNGLGGAWADVAATAQSLPKVSVQEGFNFSEGDD